MQIPAQSCKKCGHILTEAVKIKESTYLIKCECGHTDTLQLLQESNPQDYAS